MRVRITTRMVVKQGNPVEEFEDACYPQGLWRRDLRDLRIAIADGATGGYLSGPWAQLLVKTFCAANQDNDTRWVLESAGVAWRRCMNDYLLNRQNTGRPIAWYEERGLRVGAFATVLAADVHASCGTVARWSAVAVGDTNLFQVSSSFSLLYSFPATQSSFFTNQPALVSGYDATSALPNVRYASGTCSPGDCLLLATDALSKWLLEEHEAGRQPWTKAVELGTSARQSTFGNWVERQRGVTGATTRLRNDDVTLMCVRFG